MFIDVFSCLAGLQKLTSVNRMDRMQYEEITKTVIGCAFEVSNEMGSGFLESVYENALCLALRQKD